MIQRKKIRVEVLDTNFLVQHNIPFFTTDHLVPFYDNMLPNFMITKNIKCGRNKTSAILNEAMKPAVKSELANYMSQ